MNPETIYRLDFWLGKPLCFLLTIFRRVAGLLSRLAGRSAVSTPPRKILFLKLIEQGATIVGYRALERAAERVGRENVYFMVFDINRPIIDLLGIIPPDNVLSVKSTKFTTLAADMVRTIFRVRRLGIDAVVDLEFFARASAIIGFLSGARRRVGLHRFNSEAPYRGDLLTHRVQHNPYLHTGVSYYLLVEALYADPAELPMNKRPVPALSLTPPPYVPTEALRAAVRDKLERVLRRADEGPIVLLNPNTSQLLPIRNWKMERFVELARRIVAEHEDAVVVFTGGPGEGPRGDSAAQAVASDRVVSLAGQTTLPELLTLYTLSDVLVTNDSGPGHFAALTPINAVVLFGPETPVLWHPPSPRAEVVWAGLACSPCVNAYNHRFTPCRNPVCMQVITVDQVYAKVNEVLTARKQGRHALPVIAAAVPGEV